MTAIAVGDGVVRFSVRRWLLLSALLTGLFVFTALLWAQPGDVVAAEGLKALCIIGLLGLTAFLQRISDSSRSIVAHEVNMVWWREKLLAVLLACCFSAVALDMLAWREADSLLEASSTAKASWNTVMSLGAAGCVLALCCGLFGGAGWKRRILSVAVFTSLTAIFAEIGLVMSVTEPLLPHIAAVYERFATFYLVVAAAGFASYRIYVGLDEPLVHEAI